jgi:hypothetical protein
LASADSALSDQVDHAFGERDLLMRKRRSGYEKADTLREGLQDRPIRFGCGGKRDA